MQERHTYTLELVVYEHCFIRGLEVDSSNLLAAINKENDFLEVEYTQDSWDMFADSLRDAKAVDVAVSSKIQIELETNKLLEAMNSLMPLPFQKAIVGELQIGYNSNTYHKLAYSNFNDLKEEITNLNNKQLSLSQYDKQFITIIDSYQSNGFALIKFTDQYIHFGAYYCYKKDSTVPTFTKSGEECIKLNSQTELTVFEFIEEFNTLMLGLVRGAEITNTYVKYQNTTFNNTNKRDVDWEDFLQLAYEVNHDPKYTSTGMSADALTNEYTKLLSKVTIEGTYISYDTIIQVIQRLIIQMEHGKHLLKIVKELMEIIPLSHLAK